MAKRQPLFDWYLISIDRLKKIGILLLVVAVGGYVYWSQSAKSPRQRAENAISDAEESLNDLAASKDFASFRSDFDRGRVKLEEAKSLLGETKFADAESAAKEAQTIAAAALAKLPGEHDSDAQFLSYEGEVQYQKAGQSDWRKVDVRTSLFNGDWVKTGDSASAELIFSNGSLYTVGPNALLEIYSVFNPKTSKKQNTVQMQIGSVEINTTDDVSTVRTPGTQVVINSESTAQVGVDRTQQATQVVALRGSSTVTSKSGGPAVNLASGDQVRASKEGSVGSITKFVPPPALLSPADNQIFQRTTESTVPIVWGAQSQAGGYQLQVSRSRLFSSLEINARRSGTQATTRISSEGTFYWRVASIGGGGDVGPFSPFRRFRMAGIGTGAQPGSADKTPPTLDFRVNHIGSAYFMVEGTVEAGASVFVNDQEVGTESDGTFKKLISFERIGLNKVVVKAVDVAGNQTVKSRDVRVEE
ncbi:MAG TPA: FecR domain-containing protein [Thermoanaerobaculia bacterium]